MEEPNMNQQNMNNQPNMNYAPNMNYTPNMNYNSNMQNNMSEDCKPISAWGYVGYQLLFAIPIVGFICILVFGLGGATNQNLKNFARSYMCIWLIALILFVIGFICAMIFGVGLAGLSSSSYYY